MEIWRNSNVLHNKFLTRNFFFSTPFSLHDDTSILKMLRCRQLPESRNVSQSSSVYSSSSSGMASTRPFLWNSETQTPKWWTDSDRDVQGGHIWYTNYKEKEIMIYLYKLSECYLFKFLAKGRLFDIMNNYLKFVLSEKKNRF